MFENNIILSHAPRYFPVLIDVPVLPPSPTSMNSSVAQAYHRSSKLLSFLFCMRHKSWICSGGGVTGGDGVDERARADRRRCALLRRLERRHVSRLSRLAGQCKTVVSFFVCVCFKSVFVLKTTNRKAVVARATQSRPSLRVSE